MRKCRQGIPEYCVPGLPVIEASHMINLQFKLGEAHRNGNIVSTPELRLRGGDGPTTKASLRLTRDSLDVLKPPQNSFVIGLSGDKAIETQNLLDLRRYPSFEIQIEFADGSRGFMVLEKGKSGERVVSAAVDEWLQTTGGN
jgi:hypothetical protein